MRFNAFLSEMRDRFPLMTDKALLHRFAVAMRNAEESGSGTFTYNGGTFTILTEWVDGCLNGDCNPATCWTAYDIA